MAVNVRKALVAVLRASSGLSEFLPTSESIYFENAPQEAGFPFVIIHKQSGGPAYTFGDFIDSEVWIVKGIDRSDSADRVDDIAREIWLALEDADLQVDGYDLLWCRRQFDISYTETEPGQAIHHRGFQFLIEKAPS